MLYKLTAIHLFLTNGLVFAGTSISTEYLRPNRHLQAKKGNRFVKM